MEKQTQRLQQRGVNPYWGKASNASATFRPPRRIGRLAERREHCGIELADLSFVADLVACNASELFQLLRKFVDLLFLPLHFLVQRFDGQLSFTILKHLRSLHCLLDYFLRQVVHRNTTNLSRPSHEFELIGIKCKFVDMRARHIRRLRPRLLGSFTKREPSRVYPQSTRKSPQSCAMRHSFPSFVATDLSRSHNRVSSEIGLGKATIKPHCGQSVCERFCLFFHNEYKRDCTITAIGTRLLVLFKTFLNQ